MRDHSVCCRGPEMKSPAPRYRGCDFTSGGVWRQGRRAGRPRSGRNNGSPVGHGWVSDGPTDRFQARRADTTHRDCAGPTGLWAFGIASYPALTDGATFVPARRAGKRSKNVPADAAAGARRAQIVQPRATPWVFSSPAPPALKGRHRHRRQACCRALSGLALPVHRRPRALPWAEISQPFGLAGRPPSCRALTGLFV